MTVVREGVDGREEGVSMYDCSEGRCGWGRGGCEYV
jgi:hypothetical protein